MLSHRSQRSIAGMLLVVTSSVSDESKSLSNDMMVSHNSVARGTQGHSSSNDFCAVSEAIETVSDVLRRPIFEGHATVLITATCTIRSRLQMNRAG
jgi:hypothetical protein